MHGMLLMALCTASSVLASVFLKRASMALGGDFVVGNLLGSVHVWLGVSAYFVAFIGYIYALRTVPLSLVQPTITAGASVLTALIAFWFFKESISWVNWLGLLLVCTGIFLLFWGRV